jgi:hypothetical protein
MASSDSAPTPGQTSLALLLIRIAVGVVFLYLGAKKGVLAPRSSSYSSSSIGSLFFSPVWFFHGSAIEQLPGTKSPQTISRTRTTTSTRTTRAILALRSWPQEGVLGPLLLFRSQALAQFSLNLQYRVRRGMNMMFAVVFGQQALIGVT